MGIIKQLNRCYAVRIYDEHNRLTDDKVNTVFESAHSPGFNFLSSIKFLSVFRLLNPVFKRIMAVLQNRLYLAIVLCPFLLAACVGTVIETATDAAIAVVKIPVKVGGAVVDVVTGDEEEEEE